MNKGWQLLVPILVVGTAASVWTYALTSQLGTGKSQQVTSVSISTKNVNQSLMIHSPYRLGTLSVMVISDSLVKSYNETQPELLKNVTLFLDTNQINQAPALDDAMAVAFTNRNLDCYNGGGGIYELGCTPTNVYTVEITQFDLDAIIYVVGKSHLVQTGVEFGTLFKYDAHYYSIGIQPRSLNL